MINLLIKDKFEMFSYLLNINGAKGCTNGNYVFINNGAKVTLLAHMDTINDSMGVKLLESDIEHNNGVLSVRNGVNKVLGADDKAGIHIMLHMINNNCLDYNYVFTQDEEIGGIGATAFANDYKDFINSQYCFISLDRRGQTDIAQYGYNNNKLNKIFEDYGYCKEYGSYTDCVECSIVSDIACLNVSVGYMNEHTHNETMDLSVLKTVIELLTNPIVIEQLNDSAFIVDDYNLHDLHDLHNVYDLHSSYDSNYDLIEPVVCESCNEHKLLFYVESHILCEECLSQINGDYYV